MKNFARVMGLLLVLPGHIPTQNLGKSPPLPPHQTGNKEAVHHLQTYTNILLLVESIKMDMQDNVNFNQSILP